MAASTTDGILASPPYKSVEANGPPRRTPFAIATMEHKVIKIRKLTKTLKLVSFSIFDRFEGVSPVGTTTLSNFRGGKNDNDRTHLDST